MTSALDARPHAREVRRLAKLGLRTLELERDYVIAMLEIHGGSINATAKALGVSRERVRIRLKEAGIQIQVTKSVSIKQKEKR